MIQWLRSIRLSWPQTALIAGTSALATALIIGAAMGPGNVPDALVAALARPVVVRKVPKRTVSGPSAPAPAATPAGSTDSSFAGGGASSSASGGGGSEPGSSNVSGSDSTTSTTTTATTTTSTTTTTTSTTNTTPAAANTPPKPSKVKHVFILALSTPSFRAAFGDGSVARYLSGTLRREGTLLSGYQTLGSAELPDYVAMVSGQGANADTRAGCPTYAEFPAGAKPAADGAMPGPGCVYPNSVLTIGDQVTASGKQWKAYLDDMGHATCLHPNSGALDDTQLPGAGSQYATRHNPFIYFHSLLDLGDCSNDDVALNQLPKDLRSGASTPTYSFIAPGLCDDASAIACPGGQPGGLAGEDAFLKLWVPRILGSPAYRRDGALIIAFAATARATGGSPGASPIRTGALILSRYATRGRTLSASYDAYSLLRSVEDLLGYTSLVHAATAKSFVSTALPAA